MKRYVIKENGDILPIDLRLNEKSIKELLKAEEIQWFVIGDQVGMIMWANTDTDNYELNEVATKLFNQPYINILGPAYIAPISDVLKCRLYFFD